MVNQLVWRQRHYSIMDTALDGPSNAWMHRTLTIMILSRMSYEQLRQVEDYAVELRDGSAWTDNQGLKGQEPASQKCRLRKDRASHPLLVPVPTHVRHLWRRLAQQIFPASPRQVQTHRLLESKASPTPSWITEMSHYIRVKLQQFFVVTHGSVWFVALTQKVPPAATQQEWTLPTRLQCHVFLQWSGNGWIWLINFNRCLHIHIFTFRESKYVFQTEWHPYIRSNHNMITIFHYNRTFSQCILTVIIHHFYQPSHNQPLFWTV